MGAAVATRPREGCRTRVTSEAAKKMTRMPSVPRVVLLFFLAASAALAVGASAAGARNCPGAEACPAGARVLAVVLEGDDTPLLEAPAQEGVDIRLLYTHSQTGGPMQMRFTLDSQLRVVLTELWGQVLTIDIERLGELASGVRKEGDWTVYWGIRLTMDPLVIRTRVTEGTQALLVGAELIDLTVVARAGERVTVQVREAAESHAKQASCV